MEGGAAEEAEDRAAELHPPPAPPSPEAGPVAEASCSADGAPVGTTAHEPEPLPAADSAGHESVVASKATRNPAQVASDDGGAGIEADCADITSSSSSSSTQTTPATAGGEIPAWEQTGRAAGDNTVACPPTPAASVTAGPAGPAAAAAAAAATAVAAADGSLVAAEATAASPSPNTDASIPDGAAAAAAEDETDTSAATPSSGRGSRSRLLLGKNLPSLNLNLNLNLGGLLGKMKRKDSRSSLPSPGITASPSSGGGEAAVIEHLIMETRPDNLPAKSPEEVRGLRPSQGHLSPPPLFF